MIIFLICIIIMIFFIWLRYHKIYLDLNKSKKQLENCMQRIDMVQEQMQVFQNAISEIDMKITKIEQGLDNDKF